MPCKVNGGKKAHLPCYLNQTLTLTWPARQILACCRAHRDLCVDEAGWPTWLRPPFLHAGPL